jgi:Ca2+-binding EF-hand superfamily protein
VEVTNVIRETVFPAHFDAKTILKIVPWQGQLIILAVDERSATTSDLNAEISEELLTRAGHLWLVNEDAPPKLLAAKGMPETVHAFLVESDRLWVAGQNFGYLDLKDQTFHVCQKGEGPEALTDQVVALSGGTIYTLEHFGLTAFDPVLSKWRNLPTPNGRPIYSSGTQALLESNDRWLCYSAGSQSFYNISAAAWTNLTSVYSTRCLCAQGSGFWIGGGMGLHFYDPERGSLESWRPPAIFSGLRNPWRPLDLKTLAEDPGDVDMGSGFSNMPQTFRKPANNANGTIKFGPPLREPLRLDSRIPGTVNAMLKDGDSLWLAIADRVVLLDLPSRSLMAYRRFGGPVASIGVSDQNVWVGLAYGKQILVRVAKPDFYRVPRDAWKALSISLEERQQLIEKMGFRDKVMYEFYAGDMADVAKLLGTLKPGATNLDLMLLAAFANGPSVAGNPPLARAWCEQIISHHPDSPWSDFAQKELEDQAQNQKIRQHQDWLLEKFDRNHDGVLDDGEKKAMAKSVEFQREERGYRDDLLVPQLQALVKRFDHDGDGKLSARELERVKLAVAFFLETPSEKLERQKAYVTPVLTKSFPSVETLLNKYDINKDGALDADELKAFAKDIQR